MRDEDGGALPVEFRPLHETIEDGGYRVRACDHRGRDARQRRDEWGDGARGAREGGNLVRDAPVAYPNRADLRDLGSRAEPRRLQVDDHPVPARGRGAHRVEAQLNLRSRTLRQGVRNKRTSIAFVRLLGRDGFPTIAHGSLIRHRVDTNSNARPRAR